MYFGAWKTHLYTLFFLTVYIDYPAWVVAVLVKCFPEAAYLVKNDFRVFLNVFLRFSGVL